MKSSEKDRIDDWIEANVYGFFKRCMDEKRYPTQLEATMIAPLVQMYQSKQIDTVSDQLSDLWRAFIDGEAGIWFNHSTSLDVNVKDMPPSGEGKKPTSK